MNLKLGFPHDAFFLQEAYCKAIAATDYKYKVETNPRTTTIVII